MKTKHGWVLQAANGRFIIINGINETRIIRNAGVYFIRAAARSAKYLSTDIVRKVELTKTGKAKKVIPGR